MHFTVFSAASGFLLFSSASSFAASIVPVQRTSTIDIFPNGGHAYHGVGTYVDSMQGELVSASQVSTLSPLAVSFSGDVSGGRLTEIGFTIGTSSLDLTFDIDEPTPFVLDATTSAAVMYVGLVGPGVDLASEHGTHTAGTFATGRYRLEATLSQSAGTGDPIGTHHSGEGRMLLTIPEPALLAWTLTALPLRRQRH